MAETVQERTIRLLEHDPELARSLRPERREEATRTAATHVVTLDKGTWETPELLRSGRGPTYGLLVLDGLLTRTVLLRGIAAAQLLGRGDLIPTEHEPRHGLVPTETRWTVLEPTEVAVLDEYFLMTVRRWPEVVAALFERIAEQATRLDTQRALCHLPRVEDRLHALLWFLAEHWGRVTPQGILVPLDLTHELLGQLAGAKRPTVTLALKALDEAGAVHRRDDGAWLLERAWEGGLPRSESVNGGSRIDERARVARIPLHVGG